MSTEGSDRPLTRAELRAQREAAERAAEGTASHVSPLVDDRPPVAPHPLAAEDGIPIPVSSDSEGASASVQQSDPAVASGSGRIPPFGASETRPEREITPRTNDGDVRRGAKPERGRFPVVLGAVIGVLVLAGAGLTAATLLQGPRISKVQASPEQAIEASGTRVILTANEPLAAIDEKQVEVEPKVPFTVDAGGRSVGVRFTVPLDDDTDYRITVKGVSGSGGGPSSDLSTTVTTPPSQIFLLQRNTGDEDDVIFRSDLGGERGVPVFTHPKISDFRETPTGLVVAVEEDEGSTLLVMDRQGGHQRKLSLPGDGFVSTLQISDRGNLVGYNYSDRNLSDTEGRASVLVTQSLSGDDKPRIVRVGDKEASIADWRFVPDSSSLLFIDFENALSVEDPTTDAGVQSMGLAAAVLGVTRGTYTAIVERADGTIVNLDLTTGEEKEAPPTEPDYGPAQAVVPFPGGTLQHVVQRDDDGMPTGQAVLRVDDEGKAEPLYEVGDSDTILQVCASPSGQYTGIVAAPDLVNNPYDQMLLPLPETMHLHLFDTESGEELRTLDGFDVSWCALAPGW